MYNTKNRKSHVLTMVLSGILLVASACHVQPAIVPGQSSENNVLDSRTPAAGNTVAPLASYITSRTIEELVDQSELIVSGKAEIVDQIVNMARDPNDRSRVDPQMLGVGQVYRIVATNVLKGQIPEPLLIVQPEGFMVRTEEKHGQPITDQEIQRARQYYKYIPFTAEHEYLFFLEPLRGFEEESYFTGVSHPWRFDVTDPANVFPESPWYGAMTAFPPRTLAELIDEIEHVPTPIPTVESPLPTPTPSETVVEIPGATLPSSPMPTPGETPMPSPLATPDLTETVEPAASE